MTFHMNDFDSPAALAKFVNDNSIAATDIAQIWCRGSRWFIFYWL